MTPASRVSGWIRKLMAQNWKYCVCRGHRAAARSSCCRKVSESVGADTPSRPQNEFHTERNLPAVSYSWSFISRSLQKHMSASAFPPSTRWSCSLGPEVQDKHLRQTAKDKNLQRAEGECSLAANKANLGGCVRRGWKSSALYGENNDAELNLYCLPSRPLN